MLRLIKTGLARVGVSESAQDAFEYLLVIGVIMVAVVAAVAAGGAGPASAVWDAVSSALTSAI